MPKPTACSPLPTKQLGRKQEAARERATAAKLDGGEGAAGIPVGSAAPDFALLLSSGDRRVRLSEFRGKRPVVLVLGSYTCPKFRSQAPVLNALYERYHERAEFLLVYIREAHGAGSWQSTINQRRRHRPRGRRDIRAETRVCRLLRAQAQDPLHCGG